MPPMVFLAVVIFFKIFATEALVTNCELAANGQVGWCEIYGLA